MYANWGSSSSETNEKSSNVTDETALRKRLRRNVGRSQMAENCITVIPHDVIWTHYSVIYSLQHQPPCSSRPQHGMMKMLMFQRKCVVINFTSFRSRSRWQSAGCDTAWFNLVKSYFRDIFAKALWLWRQKRECGVEWLDTNFCKSFSRERAFWSLRCVWVWEVYVRNESIHNWWSKLNCREHCGALIDGWISSRAHNSKLPSKFWSSSISNRDFIFDWVEI